MRWRVAVPAAGVVIFAALALGIVFLAHNESHRDTPQENWARCNDNNPALRITGCTAIISADHEPATRLATAFVNRGSAWEKADRATQDYDKAIKLMDQAIQLDPNNANAFYDRGVAYAELAEDGVMGIDRAIADYDQAIQLDPNNASAFYRRGAAYADKNQNDRAIQDYDQAVKLDPTFADAFNSRGMTYARKGQYDRAIQDYDQAVKLDPRHYGAFYNRVIAYAAKGQYDRAIQDYDQAISLDPTSTVESCPICRSDQDQLRAGRVSMGGLYWVLCFCTAIIDSGRATVVDIAAALNNRAIE